MNTKQSVCCEHSYCTTYTKHPSRLCAGHLEYARHVCSNLGCPNPLLFAGDYCRDCGGFPVNIGQ